MMENDAVQAPGPDAGDDQSTQADALVVATGLEATVPEEAAADHSAAPALAQSAAPELPAIEAALHAALARMDAAADQAGEQLESTGRLNDRLRDAAGRYAAIVRTYDELLQRKSRHMLGLMVASIAVIVVCLALVTVMTVSFSRQVNNMNALSLALGKRLAEVNSGLVTFEELNGAIRSLETAVLDTNGAMREQGAGLDDFVLQLREEGATRLLRTQELLQQGTAGLTTQMQRLEAESARQVQALGTTRETLQAVERSLSGLEAAVDPLAELRSSVAALVTLQRERYLEAISAQQRAAAVEVAEESQLRFQRQTVTEPAAGALP